MPSVSPIDDLNALDFPEWAQLQIIIAQLGDQVRVEVVDNIAYQGL